MSANLSFARWVETAVKYVPTDLRETTTFEFESHYLDAVADYCADGLALAHAQAAALGDLGDARTTQKQLWATYRAEERYKTAVLFGTVAPFGLILPIFFTRIVAYDLMVLFFLLCPALYAFSTLQLWLTQQCGFEGAKRPLQLLQLSGGSGILIMLLSYTLSHRDLFDILGSFYFLQRGWNLETILAVFGMVSACGVGIGLLWLGEQLMTLPGSPNRILRLFRLLSIASGFTVLVMVFVPLGMSPFLLMVVSLFGVILITMEYAVLLWLLFRGIRLGQKRPLSFQ